MQVRRSGSNFLCNIPATSSTGKSNVSRARARTTFELVGFSPYLYVDAYLQPTGLAQVHPDAGNIHLGVLYYALAGAGKGVVVIGVVVVSGMSSSRNPETIRRKSTS